MTDLLVGTRFEPVLADPSVDPSNVKRVVLISGKIYYELIKERSARISKGQMKPDDIAFMRVEELAPFPFKEIKDLLVNKYYSASEHLWVQEEPRNQGAYTHVACRIEGILRGEGFSDGLIYGGREPSALPAPGVGKLYQEQQRAVIESAFRGIENL